MKLFTKISLITAAIAGGLGILGIILGLIMGADTGDLSEIGIYISPHQQVRVTAIEKVLEENHHNIEHQNYEKHNGNLNYHFSNSIQDINTLKMDVENANITIVGVSEAVDINYFSNCKINLFQMEGSTLKIKDNNTSKTPTEIELYVPVGKLDKIDIDISEGELSADKLIADSISINVEAGVVQIDELIVEADGELQTDVGKMVIGYYEGLKLKTECAMGTIMVVCEGKQSDYNFDVECGMGNIQIGENKYAGVGNDLKIHNKSQKSIKAECGMGEIIFEFPNNL